MIIDDYYDELERIQAEKREAKSANTDLYRSMFDDTIDIYSDSKKKKK